MRIIGFAFLVAAIAQSCGSSENQTSEKEESSAPWSMSVQKVEKVDASCKVEPCAHVLLTIPAVEGGNTQARSNINRHIDDYVRDALKSRLPEPEGNTPLEAMAESFLEGYDLFVLEFPDSPAAWMLEARGDSSFFGEDYYTLDFQMVDYMGGAHPNSYRYLQSFDLTSGEPINLADRYDMAGVEQLADVAFRKRHKLASDANLDDEGFFFENAAFSLPANMALSKKGLMLIYNPYEVASYALGQTVIFLPYAELPAASKPA